MIQCIRVYRVAVENAKAFVAAMRGANLWRELSRQMSMSPGLIGADLLRAKQPPWLTAAVPGGNSFHEFFKASAIYRPVGIRSRAGGQADRSAPALSPSR
jgi:hypothetical protein